MPTAIVTINGRKARVTGPTREAVQAQIDSMVNENKPPEQATHTMPDGTVMAGATHQEAPRKAGVLDLLRGGFEELGTSSGKQLSRAASGATFGALEAVTGKPEATTPGEKATLPIAPVVGAAAGLPAQAFTGTTGAVSGALGAGKVAKLVGQASGGAVVGALETPETGFADVKERGKQALIGGIAAPLTEFGIKSVAAINRTLAKAPAKIINSLVKPKSKAFRYGANPGRTVSKLGITGNSLDDLATNINKAQTSKGQEIKSKILQMPEQRYNFKVLDPIDEKLAELGKSPRQNQAAINRLQDIKDDWMQVDDLGRAGLDPNDLTPQRAFELKQQVADSAKFTGNPSDDKPVNEAVQGAYRKIKEGLNKLDPTLRKVNEEYADLITANKAVKDRLFLTQGQNIVGLSPELTGLGLGAVAGNPLVGYASGVAFRKAIRSTAVQTRLAKALSKMTQGEIIKAVQSNPDVGGALKTAIANGVIKLNKATKDKIDKVEL